MHKSIPLFLSTFLLAACAPQPQATQNPPSSDAIVWERTGGIAGICQRLTITFEGTYQLEDCANDTSLSAGNLVADQWQELSGLLDQYETFQFDFIPPDGTADMFTDRYTFNGRGNEFPTPEKQAEINARLAELASELAAGASVVIREHFSPASLAWLR